MFVLAFICPAQRLLLKSLILNDEYTQLPFCTYNYSLIQSKLFMSPMSHSTSASRLTGTYRSCITPSYLRRGCALS